MQVLKSLYSQQIPSCKPNSRSVIQEIIRLETRKFITMFTKSYSWTTSRVIVIKSTPSHPVFRTYFNIVLPSRSRYHKWSFEYSYDMEYFSHYIYTQI